MGGWLLLGYKISSYHTIDMFPLSDESKERITKAIDFSRVAMHYGYLPLIIYLGYTRSLPQPTLIKLVSPLAH